MSKEGMKLFAAVLSQMQETRVALLGSKDNKDIRLGQLLEKMKESVKEEFCKITLEK